MMKSLFLIAALTSPLAAQSWDAQVLEVSETAAQSIQDTKVSRLQTLLVETHAQAAALSVEYAKDPVAGRLVLDKWGYNLSVKTAFEWMAEPASAGMNFGIQMGRHLGTDGQIHLLGPGIGYSKGSHAGHLTEAVTDSAELSTGRGISATAGYVGSDLRYARDILAKHLAKLQGYEPKSPEEAAWKAKAVPAWTELLGKIDKASALAAELR